MSDKIQKILDSIKELSVVELNDLVKAIEEEFGVSAMPVMTAAVQPGSVGESTEEGGSEGGTVNLVLTDTGSNKIQVIKVLRELNPNLGLKDANDIVSNPPQTLAEGLDKAKAEEFKKKFEEAGAKVELK